MGKLVVIEKEELIQTINSSVLKALSEFDKQRNRNNSDETFTVNQVAKKLGMSHSTVKKRINQGYIKTSKDGRISERSIQEYLQNQ